jgi:hypothetical protein
MSFVIPRTSSTSEKFTRRTALRDVYCQTVKL